MISKSFFFFFKVNYSFNMADLLNSKMNIDDIVCLIIRKLSDIITGDLRMPLIFQLNLRWKTRCRIATLPDIVFH